MRDLFRDITQRCWINVHVPETAKAGVYRGRVTIRPQNTPPTTLNLSVRVLPFVLDRPARIDVMRREDA